jgi:threonine aldolase
MYVYIDGARLPNALVAMNTTLKEMIEETDVDAFSFGGTKAGAMFGEMVVFRRKEHFAALDYLQKQALQHMDKSKFLGAQMECLLEKELWKKNAQHANATAKYLSEKMLEKDIKPYYPVDTNMLFCVLTEAQVEKLNRLYDVSYWDIENKVVRLATTFSTSYTSIDELVSLL